MGQFDKKPLKDDQAYNLDFAKTKAEELYALMEEGAPASYERAVALAKLKESIFWFKVALEKSP